MTDTINTEKASDVQQTVESLQEEAAELKNAIADAKDSETSSNTEQSVNTRGMLLCQRQAEATNINAAIIARNEASRIIMAIMNALVPALSDIAAKSGIYFNVDALNQALSAEQAYTSELFDTLCGMFAIDKQ